MPDAVKMDEVVLAGFRGAAAALKEELKVMPLDRWSESVLRYHFCRAVAEAHLTVEQFLECSRIDLVLASGDLRAFVEFKYYWHALRYHPYEGQQTGFKGGPSEKNVQEFRSCVNQLADRDSPPGLSKYIVLFYADRAEAHQRKHTYGKHYDDYRHDQPNVMRLMETWGPIEAGVGVVRASLYEVDGPQSGGA